MLGMVLAAGLGTRLRPLTHALPKPAVPVGNRPLCLFAIEHLVRHGASAVRLNAHYLADRLVAEVESEAPSGVDLAFSVETTLLGTGGGLRKALAGMTDELVVVMNGDILFAPDLASAIASHRRSGALATLVVRHHPDPHALGAVEVDGEGRVVRIAGAPGEPRTSTTPYVFTGVHVLSPAVLALLPEEGCVVRQAYQPMLSRGLPIAAHVDDSPWLDLGTLRTYLDANLGLADGRLTASGIVPTASGLVHPSADVRGRLSRCVVGRGAVVPKGVELEDVVVWHDAVVRDSLRSAVVTRDGVVPIP
ncbi:MAG: NDP-sugar synthase [Polyangiales bacterium]